MARPLLLLGALIAWAGAADAAEVQLLRWGGRAADIPVRGPGEEQFVLPTVVRWAAGAPGDANRYEVRVALPDGRTVAHPLPPAEAPPARQLTVSVPAAAVRNLMPQAVRLRAVVIDRATGAAASNALDATISQFPTPATGTKAVDLGPFGWGRPLGASGPKSTLPRPGPQGLTFVRVSPPGADPATFLATTEASVGQVKALLPDYDPRAGRSDEFELEDPAQPAVGLSATRARQYLVALGRSDTAGIAYQLPTEDQWLIAARAGRSTAYWWGDEPTHPDGANFLGPEPALPTDTTAPARPSAGRPGFQANPWGLFHTFGNIAEWAASGGAAVRLGGHFRTEPESPLPPVAVEDPTTTGPDPYVGVRPAFAMSAALGAARAQAALKGAAGLEGVTASFDPGRATVVLAGQVAEPSARREADRRIAGLWYVAAVEDRINTPAAPPNALAMLGRVVGRAQSAPLGRRLDERTVEVRWSEPLPVAGSDWYVNVYGAGGGHFAHRLVGGRPDASGRIQVLIDRALVPAGSPSSAALSLGAPAPTPNDPRVVSNLAPLDSPGP